MRVPNRFHNSGKPPKRTLKPQALRAARASRAALKRKLQVKGYGTSTLV